MVAVAAALVGEALTGQSVLSMLWGRYKRYRQVEWPVGPARSAALVVAGGSLALAALERVVTGVLPPRDPLLGVPVATQVRAGGGVLCGLLCGVVV